MQPTQTMPMNNIFNNIPKDLSAESFSELLKTDTLKIERIVSKGHTSPASGWYDQADNEWLLLLQGQAILSFENKPELRLQAGDSLNIPAHQKHKVSWTEPNIETIWLTVHY